MKILFYSYNLLGDALQTTPSIRGFYYEFGGREQGVEITVATHDNFIAQVYRRMGVPATVWTKPAEELLEREFDLVFDFNISKAFKLGVSSDLPAAAVFSIMLGVRKLDGVVPLLPVWEVPKDTLPLQMYDPARPDVCGTILFQPYSVSCSSWTGEPANKRWPDECWAEVYRRLRRDVPWAQVFVLGGPKDYVIGGIPAELHQFGLSLDVVARMQQEASLVFTIDSGAAHLAASQQARMLELYPECLPKNWMSNLSNPNTRVVWSRPADLPVDYVYGLVLDRLRRPAVEKRSLQAVANS